MDHSFRYTARDFTAELPAAAYVARFRDAERVGGYCRECGNYGRSWGCPPFGFDMEEYVTRYGTALLVATRITPEEPGLPVSEAGRLILPERQRLERRLLEMERQYGGRSFAYVGTCIHCPEGSCTRPEGRPCRHPELVRPSSNPQASSDGRTRSGWRQGLRTVRNRDEVGQRRPHARVPDARMRIFPRRGIGRMERIRAVFNRSGGKDSAHAPLRPSGRAHTRSSRC